MSRKYGFVILGLLASRQLTAALKENPVKGLTGFSI
jgi:hypothetical protein